MDKPTSLADLGFLDVAELAKLLDVEPLTLRNWRAKRIGPPHTKVHGCRVVYPIDGVKKWLQQQTVSSVTTPTLTGGAGRRRPIPEQAA